MNYAFEMYSGAMIYDISYHWKCGLRLALSKGFNREVSSSPHLKLETAPVFKTLFSIYLEFQTMDKVRPETQ
jgi:hypothetical protein